MVVLLLRLEGPMQSWGTYSRFTERDSGKEPSKSGVIGLLCSALGRARNSDISDLAAMRMAIRVDREGVFSRDFHTTLEVPRAGNPGFSTVISNRYYLSDACFLATLEGSNHLVVQLSDALKSPKWGLFLGRKAFTPSAPILLEGGEKFDDCSKAIRNFPWLGRPRDHLPEALRAIVECSHDEGEARLDVPISFAKRSYALRFVRTEWIPTSELQKEG